MERYGEEEVPEGEPHEEVGVSRGRRCGSKESCHIYTTSLTSRWIGMVIVVMC